jgi:hypothetical protein
VDTWGAHDTLFVGSVLTALAIAGLGSRISHGSVRWLVIVVAAASALVTVAATAVMPYALLGPDEPAASLNLGFIAVAFGYLVLPPLVDGLCRRLGFARGMIALAAFCLVPAAFAIFISRDELTRAATNVDVNTPLSSPAIWLAALAAFFCFPLESSLGSWTADYLKNVGHTARQVAFWQGVFWAIFLGSRLITGQYLVPGYERWFVLVLVVIAAVTLGNLAGAYGPTSARGLLVLAGALGPLIPSLLGTIMPLVAQPGMALAMVYVCGGAGMLAFGPALAAANLGQPVHAGMRAPLAVTLLMSVPILVLALLR